MWAAARRRIRSWARDRRGNVAMLFGLAALPLIGVIGLSIDYGYMLSVKAKLDLAADAAAVAGATGVNSYFSAYTGSSNPTTAAIAAAQSQATAQFNSNKGVILANGTLTLNTPNIALTNTTVTSQVSYTYSMPTFFMAVLGSKTMKVSGSSTATVTLPTYVNVFIVIDNSQSMGIGAQLSDQQIIYDASTNTKYVPNGSSDRSWGCAIACHYSGKSGTYGGYSQNSTTDLTNIVRGLGAQLRIDVAKSAITTALGQITNGNVNFAVFTTSATLTQVYPVPSSGTGWNCQTTSLSPTAFSNASTFQNPGGSLTAAETAVTAIDLQDNIVFPSGNSSKNSFTNGDGGTFLTNAMGCLYTQLNGMKTAGVAPGNGLTASTPISFVVLVTDGVQDSARETQYSSTSPVLDYPYFTDTQPAQSFTELNNCSNSANCQLSDLLTSRPLIMEAMDSTTCTPIKTLGYTLMTLEVQYIIPPLSVQGSSGAAEYLFPMAAAITGASTSGGSSQSTAAVATAMQSCATSSTYAYSANTPSDITAAANAMFGSIVKTQAAHLSQ